MLSLLRSRDELEDCFKDMYRMQNMPQSKFMQYKMSITNKSFIESNEIAPNAAPSELPHVNDKCKSYKKRYVYTNCKSKNNNVGFVNSIQKVDLENPNNLSSNVISFGEGVYAGAPIFVPRKSLLLFASNKKDPDNSNNNNDNDDDDEEDDGYVFTQLYRSNDHGSDICILNAKTMEKVALLRLDAPVPYQFHGDWCTMATKSN